MSQQRENFVRLRQRSRILTPEALTRLQQAIRAWELQHEKKCTQERIRELTSEFKEGGLDQGTISKIRKGREGVDAESIRHVFRAFGLQLQETDLVSSAQAMFQVDPNFVGREGAIADLNMLVSREAKVIVIQARGGVGKTTLARKYLQQEFGKVLEFPIAKETKDIASIESLIEEKLRQLGEEPGREFLVSIDRFKRKLQAERIGILIDNLEPALDSAGRLIEAHRRYVELLRVLADPSVRSLTLITSRERLHEPSVAVQHYPLRSLEVAAWEQFFQLRQLATDTPALAALHHAYGGNAKAMEILSSVIKQDYSEDIEAYWQENQNDLLIERDLEDLVTNQFDRLQAQDEDAYKLLYRMGCYRYQDVPTVPIEGLFCLLWDVPENRQRRVVRVLQERSLVDVENGEYWLHPVIRSEAIRRLSAREDWERANREAAALWQRSTQILLDSILDSTVALQKLEIYHHFIHIGDWDQASQSLMEKIDRIYLIEKLRDFGYVQKCMEVLALLFELSKLEAHKISHSSQGNLYAFWGDLYTIVGDFQRGINSYKKAIEFKSHVDDREDFYVDSVGALSVLYLNLGDYEQAIESFLGIVSDAEKLIETRGAFLTYIHAGLSLLYGYREDFGTSLFHLELALKSQQDLRNCHYTWIRMYGFYNLGRALTIHTRLDEAKATYQALDTYSSCSSNEQAKGYIHNGTGRIKAKELNMQESLEEHEIARKIFQRIGAKFDTAETCYYVGLAYQAISEIEKANESFREAIQFFNEIEAPKQVERVRRSMQQGG